MKPLTFFRQLVASCACPELLEKNIFPSDVNSRAKRLLEAMGGSVGSYTPSPGITYICERVAKFIEYRDGYATCPSNVILTNGASSGIKLIVYSLTRLHQNGLPSGIMVPIPQYPIYSAAIAEFSGKLISYYLNEDKNWELDIEECERAYLESLSFSVPRAMVVINPGNPSSQVLQYKNMVEIVHFCARHKLILLADEVYQQNIYDESCKFTSFKKVVRDCGYMENDFVLVSFNSISKGFYAECGLRGGYMELFGFNSDVKNKFLTLLSSQLCSSSLGQIVIEAMTNPPKPEDESFNLYSKEKSAIISELSTKAAFLHSELNSIPGMTCNKIQGALYGFPRLYLPDHFIAEAKKLNLEPDFYYCRELLEETGICVVPGSGFKQKPGTYHFRTTIIPSLPELRYMTEAIRLFTCKVLSCADAN